jgi:recombination protein RecA
MAVPQKPKAERMKALKNLITNINKKEGYNAVNFASDPEIKERITVDFYPVKSLALRNAIQGVPKGKMTLAVGNPDSGKTSWCLETIAYNQEIDPDFIAGWVESEGSLSDEMLDMFGIDKTRFIYYEVDPDNGAAEKALDYTIAMAKAGCSMIVINSLKCLVPKKETTDSMEDANVALSARLNAKFMRVIIPTISKSGTSLVVVQHKSTDIGSYGGGTTITGGRAIVYNSVLTLDFNKITIKSGDPYYDKKDDFMRIRVRCLKNHVTVKQPYTVTDYTVQFGVGTDVSGEIIQAAYDFGIIYKEPGGYTRMYPEGVEHDKKNVMILPDGTKAEWRGAANFQAYVDSHPEFFEFIKERVLGLDTSSMVESLSEEEIAEIEAANAEDELEGQALIDSLDDVLATNEDE